jgi:hypothetical protein
MTLTTEPDTMTPGDDTAGPIAPLDLTDAVTDICARAGVPMNETLRIEILPDRVRLTAVLRDGHGRRYLDPDTQDLACTVRTLSVVIVPPAPAVPAEPPQE